MLLLARVPQTGQFVGSILAPKHLDLLRLVDCVRVATYKMMFFFPNWVGAGLYVPKLCLSLAVGPLGLLLNWVLHRLVLCTEFCKWLLLFVSYDCIVAQK